MSTNSDPHNLQRFVDAQDGVYADALEELRRGAKETHWMWFIFPQVAGLGRSSTAQFFAIASREEAKAYLGHELLGPRLRECAEALLSVEGKTAEEIMGHPDDRKLQSSMTLFAEVAGPDPLFTGVLRKYFGGERDAATLQLLGSAGKS